MRAALDTNAIIDLCENDAWAARAVRHFSTNQVDSLVLIAHSTDELDEDRLEATARANLRQLEAACKHDDQRYFTIGKSTIAGPDVLRGDTVVRDGIQREVYDIHGAYERYRTQREASGLPAKGVERWNNNKNNNQADAVIYERATELGCDFLVTADERIKRKVPAANSCQPITLADFIARLDP